jgi:hypothetical protein
MYNEYNKKNQQNNKGIKTYSLNSCTDSGTSEAAVGSGYKINDDLNKLDQNDS